METEGEDTASNHVKKIILNSQAITSDLATSNQTVNVKDSLKYFSLCKFILLVFIHTVIDLTPTPT